MSKTEAELREDIKAAEGFFRAMRGKRGSQLSEHERDQILAGNALKLYGFGAGRR